MEIIMYALLGIGGALCCLNFYLSYLRYPLYRLRGGVKDNFSWSSGIPVVGSLCVAVSLYAFWGHSWISYVALVLIAIDTGGVHWMIGSAIFHQATRK